MTAPLAKPTLTLRDALRASTRFRHEALDRALMPPVTAWTRLRYRQFLRGTLATIGPLEPAIDALVPGCAPAQTPSRVIRLRADLHALGDDAVVEPIASPGLSGVAAALGSAYVLEGAMLGGQHVAQAVVRDLAVDAASLAYLRPPGVAIGARWKAFVAGLDAFGATAPAPDWRAAEQAAAATFAAFAAAFRREGLI